MALRAAGLAQKAGQSAAVGTLHLSAHRCVEGKSDISCRGNQILLFSMWVIGGAWEGEFFLLSFVSIPV